MFDKNVLQSFAQTAMPSFRASLRFCEGTIIASLIKRGGYWYVKYGDYQRRPAMRKGYSDKRETQALATRRKKLQDSDHRIARSVRLAIRSMSATSAGDFHLMRVCMLWPSAARERIRFTTFGAICAAVAPKGHFLQTFV